MSKHSKVIIREAEPEEASLLSTIAYDAKGFWNYPDEFMRLWENDLTVTPDFISANVVRCVIADSTIIGFYALSDSDTHFELEHLWISPKHIGKGIGSELFDDARTYIANQGGGVLKILTDPNAEAFYLKQGAQRIGKLPSKPAGRTLPLLQLSVEKEYGKTNNP